MEPILLDLAERLRLRSSEIEGALVSRLRDLSDSLEASWDVDHLRPAVAREIVAQTVSGIEQGAGWQPSIPPTALAILRTAVRDGMTLEEFLRLFSGCYNLVSEFVMQEVVHVPPEALRFLLAVQSQYADHMIGLVSTAYQDEAERFARSPNRRLAERVQQLLAGVPADINGLGYDLDAWHIGLIAVGPKGDLAVRGLAEKLGCTPLLVGRDTGTFWAWLGARRSIPFAELERHASPVLGASVALAVGESRQGLEGWRMTHREAQTALSVLRREPGRLVRCTDVLLPAAVIRDGAMVRFLLDAYLGPLNAHNDVGALKRTLRTYFELGGNAASTAASLDVDRHTVQRRLRRAEQSLGRSLDTCRAELEVALRVEQLASSDDTDPGPSAEPSRPAGDAQLGGSLRIEAEGTGGRTIPAGRYQRLARVGRAAGTEAAKRAGTHAANLMRSEDRAALALGRRHIETAEQLVSVLGTMKGAAMKLGQMLSVLDVGLVPEAYREEFQQKLAALRDSAPSVPFGQMQEVVETEHGRSLAETFSAFDAQPIAAASIGQVYRAELRDGREVAVKVQYPGVDAAVRADMQNFELFLRLLGRIAPQLDTKALAAEVRGEIFEELDYEQEAANQRVLADIYRGHPFIFIPDVTTELSGKRVIVTEFVEGDAFAELEREPQAERNRVGEIVLRFFLGSMYRHRKFSGDAHPGNLLRRPDGTIAFLDFGLFKRMAREPVEGTLGVLRAMIEGEQSKLHRLFADAGFLPDPSRIDPAELMTYLLDAYWWCTKADRDLEITPEFAEGLTAYVRPGTEQFELTRRLSLNPEHLLGRRLEAMVLAVLGQLRATANWHRISREWIYGDPPATELGRQEAAFLQRHP